LVLVFALSTFALEPKSFSTLQQQYPSSQGAATPSPDDTSSTLMANGFPQLSPRHKKLIEKCIFDPFFTEQLACGNNPYSGLVRLSFHDCATFDGTDTDPTTRGGCHAWMTKKCTVLEQCEFTALANNGLAKWVIAVDDIYDNAQLKGKPLSQYLSRPDFWHLGAFRAIGVSSGFQVPLTYHGGRENPVLPDVGPRFPERIPDADAWANMQAVVHRNGMDDFHGAALIGAHTIGSCHPQNLGYQGSWDHTPFVFDAGFYQNMLGSEWHIHTINSVNSLSGLPDTEQQFSLGGDNFDSSVMLFSDMGSHIDLTNPQCDINGDQVATGTCPQNPTPAELQAALEEWAADPSTFFSIFSDAYQTMSQWGCDNTYSVDEVAEDSVTCGSLYTHTCQPMYTKATYHYKPDWATPAPMPTTQAPTTQAPKKYY